LQYIIRKGEEHVTFQFSSSQEEIHAVIDKAYSEALCSSFYSAIEPNGM
jgi:hypothetical protein